MKAEPARQAAAAGSAAGWIATAVWTLVVLAPNVLALPAWPWVVAQTRTPVDQATQLLAGGYLTAIAISALLCLALLAVTGRGSRYVLVTLPFAPLVPLESLYILKYGQPTNAVAFGVASATHWGEAAEFVTGIVAYAVLASAAITVAGIALAVWLHNNDLGWHHRSRWYALLGIFIVAAVGTAQTGGWHDLIARPADAAMEGSGEIATPLERTFERSYPLGLIVRWNEFHERRRRVVEAAARASGFQFGAKAGDGAATVVLVIGESMRADHLGLHGYRRNTTPELSKIGSLYSFRHATAAAGATRESIPYLLTRRPLGVDPDELVAERSIISAFREAGFSTWWISTQAPVGALEDTSAAIAEESANKRYLNPADYARRATLDEATIPVLADALRDGAARRFVVVHLLQAHWDYRLRYPASSEAFQPAGADGEIWSIYSKSRRTSIVNAYDNAVRYADQVLARLIQTLQASGQSAALIYMSDHGQALFEGRCLSASHALPSRTVFEVPLLVWVSPAFGARFPDKVAALAGNVDRPVTAESVFPTLAELGALEFEGSKRHLSLANAAYAPGRRLVTLDTRNWIDFERELPAMDCAGSR
jgi:glucan phosphoethanolaminetransferase (alkaline phosphatase superfamily)